MNRPKILVVDDEQDFRDSLKAIFANEFELHFAADGVRGLEKAKEIQPDLVLLDILMPRMDGFQTCLKLRQDEATRRIPVIFLTTKSEPESEAFGLELGADDFVTKPFHREVLLLRVKKRLGHAQEPEGEEADTPLEDYTIHWARQEVTCNEQRIPITTKEFRLLRLFVDNRGKVLSRNVILDKVWNETYITDRTIDSHVKELRKKIPPLVRMLKTVYGAGYRLDI